MKKLFYGVSLLLVAFVFASCGNTEMCYKVTTTYKLLGQEMSTVDYLWITKNQLRDAEADIKSALVAIGVSEDVIEVSSVPALNGECGK
ncbi:MAG: hypothetical protein J6V13_00625 [Paludibacteraceae bacterium]|nr:hypothetical protein [Paludibacteraceae bacterium]MBO7259069.1 hypothetical protein [Paludibacteraceae bacterium]